MSRRKRIEAEEKIRIAKVCVSGTTSLNAAAGQLGVHQSVVDDWVRLYQTEGIAAFLQRAGHRHYDPVLKEAAVKDYLSGKGVYEIYVENIRYGIKKNSELGLRCIMVIKTSRNKEEEAV